MEYKTLYEQIFKQKNLFFDISMMVFGVFVLAVLSNIRIPLWPVPITMQTLGVFMIALFFGSRKGVLTLLMYIFAGAVGLGVFSGKASGMATLLGPTGGYLLGFIVAVYVVGRLVENGFGRDFKSVIYCMVVGNVVIYFFGIAGLWFYLGDVGITKVLTVGLVPFLIGDVLKIIVASTFFPKMWRSG